MEQANKEAWIWRSRSLCTHGNSTVPCHKGRLHQSHGRSHRLSFFIVGTPRTTRPACLTWRCPLCLGLGTGSVRPAPSSRTNLCDSASDDIKTRHEEPRVFAMKARSMQSALQSPVPRPVNHCAHSCGHPAPPIDALPRPTAQPHVRDPMSSTWNFFCAPPSNWAKPVV